MAKEQPVEVHAAEDSTGMVNREGEEAKQLCKISRCTNDEKEDIAPITVPILPRT